MAGQLSDAEYMIEVAKAERRLMELRRGFPLTVRESARLIANLAYSGLKNYQPYFVVLLVAGVDHEDGHVLAADMSGAITDEDFASSGSGSPIAYGVLESAYSKDLTNENVKQIASKAVAGVSVEQGNNAIEKALGETPLVETGIVTAKDGYFRKLVNNDIRDLNDMVNS